MKRKIDRQDILDAGMEIMFLNGYNATGIKDITEKINIPKGSFYNHFKSKEIFGLEILAQYCENGVKLHETNLIHSSLSPLERIDKFYTELIEGYKEKDYKLGCIMGNFSQELGDINENFRKELDEGFSAIQNVIAKCIDEAKELGEVKATLDSQLIAGFIHNSWQGAMLRMKSTGTVKPLEDFKSSIFQLLKS